MGPGEPLYPGKGVFVSENGRRAGEPGTGRSGHGPESPGGATEDRGVHRGPRSGEREAVLELGAGSRFFVELLDSLPGLLFLLDERGRYVFWNRKVGRRLTSFVANAGLHHLPGIFAAALRG